MAPRCAPAAEASTSADAVAGNGDKPPLRIFGHARIRPGAQGPLEGVAERIFSEHDVSRRRCEQGHQPAVRRSRVARSAAELASSAVI